jgi:hypothetical protein
VAVKQIAHSTPRNAEKSTASEAVEETAYDHSLDVLRHGTRDQPYQKEGKRDDVNPFPTIKLWHISSGTQSHAESTNL